MADKKAKINKQAVKKAASRKKQIFMFVLCSMLALVICMSAVLGVSLSLITEGVYEFPEENKPSLTDMPTTKDETVDFLKKLTADATDNSKTFVKSNVSVSVEDDSIEIISKNNENTDKLLNLVKYAKNDVLSSVDSMYPEDYTGKFADEYKGYPVVTLTGNECTEAECTAGQKNDKDEIVDDNYYFLSLTVPGGKYPADEKSNIYKTFSLSDEKEIIDKIKKETESEYNLESYSIVPGDFKIEAKSDRFTDRISNISFIRDYSVELNITPLNKLRAYAGKLNTVKFNYTVTENYEYIWAGVTFSEDSVTIEADAERALSVNAVMNENSDYDISFKSSDTSVATIDDLGYVKGIKTSNEPVTITVTLNYLGNTYTDECVVYVRKPVEKIVISDDKLSMNIGESKKLSVKFEPKDATDTDVIWISEDEKIGTVTADGTVTAISGGTVKIIAVSDDGSYRDSCTLTVAGGGESNE